MSSCIAIAGFVCAALTACGDDGHPQTDAPEPRAASLTIMSASAPYGRVGEVAVSYDPGDSAGAAAIAFDVEADTGAVLVDAVSGPIALETGKTLSTRLRGDGSLQIIIIGPDATVLPSGELAMLRVRAADAGRLELRVRAASASDAAGAAVVVTTVPGTLEVSP